MKIDTTQPLIGYDGKQLQNDSDGLLTIRAVSCSALTADFQDEQDLSGEEKVRRQKLATQIYQESTVTMTIEDVALVRQLINKGYGTAIVGSAWPLLDSGGEA